MNINFDPKIATPLSIFASNLADLFEDVGGYKTEDARLEAESLVTDILGGDPRLKSTAWNRFQTLLIQTAGASNLLLAEDAAEEAAQTAGEGPPIDPDIAFIDPSEESGIPARTLNEVLGAILSGAFTDPDLPSVRAIDPKAGVEQLKSLLEETTPDTPVEAFRKQLAAQLGVDPSRLVFLGSTQL